MTNKELEILAKYIDSLCPYFSVLGIIHLRDV